MANCRITTVDAGGAERGGDLLPGRFEGSRLLRGEDHDRRAARNGYYRVPACRLEPFLDVVEAHPTVEHFGEP
jgi:hypothetical protein